MHKHDKPDAPVTKDGARRRARRSALPLAAAGLLTALAATACSVEPGGVELGKDWKGARAFALSEVDGQLTVIGVNPVKGKAEPLVVVPSQADDNDTLAPQIVRLADGRWMISVPRKGGKPDRLYALDRKDHSVAVQGAGVESLHGLFPARSRVAAVPGLPDEDTHGGKGTGGPSAILVQNPADWTTDRTVRVPGTVSLAASSRGSDTLCVTRDAADGKGRTRVSTVGLTDGKVTEAAAAPEGFTVQQLACADGTPVLAGAGSTQGKTSAGSGRLDVAHKDGNVIVTADGGRVDQLAVDGDTLVAAVFHKDHERLVTLDMTSGKETHRVTLPGLTDAAGLQHTERGWLALSDEGAVLTDPASGATKKIGLPGKLLAS
ncbi:hypothetical protein C3486_20375 [Streptomyces sp. Ru73]|uniref:hypothetical protein n=1 Tax=Streptomyces sp. Ru73 TaxID=2080748 RepID=UPI000CDE42D9|nr:hypothetical protein [Streptomyces sp. Ru73]POX39034.1 hypothetical protein C3486_20375 [Streptomyces sp. Ru73]